MIIENGAIFIFNYKKFFTTKIDYLEIKGAI